MARPSATIPPTLRNKLRYTAAIAEITRGGIDARREDGSNVLLVWRDIVGAVARRLPKDYASATFVDIVSTSGSTLRFLAWTRLAGDGAPPPPPNDAPQTEAECALAVLNVIVQHCPDITLDPATRAFIERRGEAAQLPDLKTLAAHDERLA
ncbi:MAG: hypothetical protein H0V17_29260 [Deltaproteobacteria bacterium]|nr:hypothetical protein [Deltaproteobacteria bacterium]